MIGENIRQKLKEKKVSTAELSRKAGIPVSTLYCYVNNTRMPSAGALKKIADSFNTTVDELLKEPQPLYPSTDEFRNAPGADAMFIKNGFYDRMTPEDKEMLESVLQNIKKRYVGGK